MTLTICAVTKGRDEFLAEWLRNLNEVLNLDFVRIILISNGAPIHISSKLNTWAETHKGKVKFFRFEENSTDPQRIWKVLEKEEVEWLMFPGDDDLLEIECLRYWHEELNSQNGSIGFAFAVEKIDFNGHSLGTLYCATSSRETITEKLARAFHEPPFIWPSLIFDFKLLNREVPNSRYAFDWWVQISLLSIGEVKVCREVMLKYRVHASQESSIADLSRKYFEATAMLRGFVKSESFLKKSQSMTSDQIIYLWKCLLNTPPIYGDAILSSVILYEVMDLLIENVDNETKEALIASFALENNVVVKDQDLCNLAPYIRISTLLKSNLKLEAIQSCINTLNATKLFTGTINTPTLKISCSHSSSKEAVKINCSLFTGDLKQDADYVAIQLSFYLASTRGNPLKLTAGERLLLFFFRRYRNSVLKPFLPISRRIRLKKN